MAYFSSIFYILRSTSCNTRLPTNIMAQVIVTQVVQQHPDEYVSRIFNHVVYKHTVPPLHLDTHVPHQEPLSVRCRFKSIIKVVVFSQWDSIQIYTFLIVSTWFEIFVQCWCVLRCDINDVGIFNFHPLHFFYFCAQTCSCSFVHRYMCVTHVKCKRVSQCFPLCVDKKVHMFAHHEASLSRRGMFHHSLSDHGHIELIRCLLYTSAFTVLFIYYLKNISLLDR